MDVDARHEEHASEDLVHLLAGQMEITVGSESFTLQAGDSLHLNGTLPHRRRILSERAQVLVVASHPIEP